MRRGEEKGGVFIKGRGGSAGLRKSLFLCLCCLVCIQREMRPRTSKALREQQRRGREVRLRRKDLPKKEIDLHNQVKTKRYCAEREREILCLEMSSTTPSLKKRGKQTLLKRRKQNSSL